MENLVFEREDGATLLFQGQNGVENLAFQGQNGVENIAFLVENVRLGERVDCGKNVLEP